MYGAGVAVFAVWTYVIAHAKRGRVELNPRMLADILGGTEEEVKEAIEKLSAPDPNSRHKAYDGRRMVKEGEFQYFLPSWEYYQAIRNEDERRQYNRRKMREHREREYRRKFEKVVTGGVPSLAEKLAVKAEAYET